MSGYKFISLGKYPIIFFISISFLSSSFPLMYMYPFVLFIKPIIVLIVVDLPAPFGPIKPYISPLFNFNDTSSIPILFP